MKFDDPNWRFTSPGRLPDGAVSEFFELAKRTAVQGRVQDILEDFKTRFSSSQTTRSSTPGWAEHDLWILMQEFSQHAPLFIEAFVNACDDLRQQGYDVPSIDHINGVLTRHNAWFQVQGDKLVKAFWSAPQDDENNIYVEEPRAEPPVLDISRPEQLSAGTAILSMSTAAGSVSSSDPAIQLKPALRPFLCHASGDKEAVRELYRRLKADRYNPWLDEEDLLPGDDWRVEIPKAVKTCDFVIVCLSKHSISKTGYVQKEITFALDAADERPEGTTYIIPALLEDCDIPERLSRWHAVSLFKAGGYERLLKAFEKVKN